MPPEPSLTSEDIAALCARTFPDRQQQSVVEVKSLDSRQHEMIAFELWWYTNDGVMKHEDLIVRRYVSTLSWWRPDDNGKAQRETTICRWLDSVGFPVPVIYAREFDPSGDIVLFQRLPSQEIGIGGRPLHQVIKPYIRPFAQTLAHLHSLSPPYEVKNVVPQVTLPGALANLTAIAFQIDLPELREAVNKLMERAYDVPEAGPVVVHGDYHFFNALLVDGEITGVIDWEYAALGDPRWDVANAYMQLVDFGAANAADQFLNFYLQASNRQFEGPPLFNAVTPLQQWAISEWLVQNRETGELPDFTLAEDLIILRNTHRRRAEMALKWLDNEF